MAEYFTKDGDEYKPVEDNLLTQADVDGVVEKRLERERKKFDDYDQLKEKAGKVDTVTKDFEKQLKEKDTEISTVKGDLGKAQLETTKVKVMNEFKLSEDMSEFINGEDEDTIRSQAEKLSKGVGGSTVKIDKKTKPGEKSTDSKTIAKNLFGGKSDD